MVLAICRYVRHNFGDRYCLLLQETPAWGPLAGNCDSGLTVVAEAGSDCGVLRPRRWLPSVRCILFGQYWCIILFDSIILVSAHILVHCAEGGRAQVLFEVTLSHITSIRSMHSHLEFTTIVGVDAHVTLQKSFDDIIGTKVLFAPPSHCSTMARLFWVGFVL